MINTNETEFKRGDSASALITKDMLSDMITAEFQMQKFIPYNVSLVVKGISFHDQDEVLELSLQIEKELLN